MDYAMKEALAARNAGIGMIGADSMKYANAVKESETQAILSRLDKLAAVLAECQAAAGRAGDKLVGMEPAQEASGAGQIRGGPNGFLSDLNGRASDLLDGASRLLGLLNRIDRVF